METVAPILKEIKNTVLAKEPRASIYLYGSYARGEQREDSDMDILVLLDNDTVTLADKENIWSTLFFLSIDCGVYISAVVFSKNKWDNMYPVTPFRRNVEKDGILL